MFSKCHFFVLKIKRNLFAIIFLIFAICLLLFSKNNLPAIKTGLTLWATSVVPSLFPFFVATELLLHTSIISFLGRLLNKIMKPLFNISGSGAFCFIMGLISGYPVGAKIATEFRNKNICSKPECERLLSFTNNSGPLFIIGTVGISMFGNTQIGILLLITHILGCISVGILFRFWGNKNNSNTNTKKHTNTTNAITNNKNKNFDKTSQESKNYIKTPSISNTESITISNLGKILSESITSSTNTILMIGGFIIIFSSIISILNTSGIFKTLTLISSPIFKLLNLDTNFCTPILTGILEITNGIKQISMIPIKTISINIILSAFLLGFGGISVFLQVYSITSKSDLSIKPYIYGKLLHGLLSALFTYIAIQIFPFFNLDL